MCSYYTNDKTKKEAREIEQKIKNEQIHYINLLNKHAKSKSNTKHMKRTEDIIQPTQPQIQSINTQAVYLSERLLRSSPKRLNNKSKTKHSNIALQIDNIKISKCWIHML